MVRECRPPAREPGSSWLARRSTMATSTPANASSPANIIPVGPPPAITTVCSATLRASPSVSLQPEIVPHDPGVAASHRFALRDHPGTCEWASRRTTIRLVEIPEVRYAKTADGTHIAFQVFGQGPRDLVYLPGFISNLLLNWELPGKAHILDRLARFARVIVIDHRGT